MNHYKALSAISNKYHKNKPQMCRFSSWIDSSVSKTLLLIIFCSLTISCNSSSPEITRIQARVVPPSVSIEPGEHPLGLGGFLLINRSILKRDGILYVPSISSSSARVPLLVWLHGGGGDASSYRYLFPLAEQFGIALLIIDSRHNTWDGIDSPFGPDVLFIDAALKHTFERITIDPKRIALGGISDGAAYALAIGRANGDFFTHLIAIAPGYLNPPSPPVGKPRIFVAHGTRDNVYSVLGSRYFVVPRLKSADYDVNYLEFDGPHWMPEVVARQVLKWLRE